MRSEFRMPSLGPDMEQGTLVEWRAKPGDKVKRGDIVALIETDKGIIDVEIFVDGVISKLLVSQGAQVPVGTPLAELETSDVGAPPLAPQSSDSSVAQAATTAAAVPAAPATAVEGIASRRKVSPAARARAHELGLDVSNVKGSGFGGVVTIDDVIRAGEGRPPTSPTKPEVASHDRDMRQIIGRAMSRSKREIPHYYLTATCSFEKARSWLDLQNAGASVEQRILPPALFLKAIALAARAMGDFNGFHQSEGFQPATDVHVGMAIAMRGGRLVAPAILNADAKSLQIVMSELRDLTLRVRNGHMRATELSMPTITVTSLGEDGVDAVIPVIYPPQVAIVGVGSIVERPWVEAGVVKPAHIVTLSLAADHRVTDGRAGSKFLSHIVGLLQSPERL